MSKFTFKSKVEFLRSIGVEESVKDDFIIRSVCWPGQLYWCLKKAMGSFPPTYLANLISDVDITRTFLQT